MPIINLESTGCRIKELMKENDVKVRDIQNRFGFATPQAIYKWLHGTCLPTVDNLVILASILNVKVDDILMVE